jgi:hypothetical protein
MKNEHRWLLDIQAGLKLSDSTQSTPYPLFFLNFPLHFSA